MAQDTVVDEPLDLSQLPQKPEGSLDSNEAPREVSAREIREREFPTIELANDLCESYAPEAGHVLGNAASHVVPFDTKVTGLGMEEAALVNIEDPPVAVPLAIGGALIGNHQFDKPLKEDVYESVSQHVQNDWPGACDDVAIGAETVNRGYDFVAEKGGEAIDRAEMALAPYLPENMSYHDMPPLSYDDAKNGYAYNEPVPTFETGPPPVERGYEMSDVVLPTAYDDRSWATPEAPAEATGLVSLLGLGSSNMPSAQSDERSWGIPDIVEPSPAPTSSDLSSIFGSSTSSSSPSWDMPSISSSIFGSSDNHASSGWGDTGGGSHDGGGGWGGGGFDSGSSSSSSSSSSGHDSGSGSASMDGGL